MDENSRPFGQCVFPVWLASGQLKWPAANVLMEPTGCIDRSHLHSCQRLMASTCINHILEDWLPIYMSFMKSYTNTSKKFKQTAKRIVCTVQCSTSCLISVQHGQVLQPCKWGQNRKVNIALVNDCSCQRQSGATGRFFDVNIALPTQTEAEFHETTAAVIHHLSL